MPLVTLAKNVVEFGSPYTHFRGAFAFVPLVSASASPGNSVSSPNNIQAYMSNPFDYAWIYDIVVECTAATATATVDVTDTYSTSGAGNSYLTGGSVAGPIAIAAQATPQAISARKAGYLSIGRNPELAGSNELAWAQGSLNGIPFVLTFGQLFVVRAVTNGSGSITNLQVTVILQTSDEPMMQSG